MIRSRSVFHPLFLLCIVVVLLPASSLAHRSGCHRWGTCPPDTPSTPSVPSHPRVISPSLNLDQQEAQPAPSTGSVALALTASIEGRVVGVADGDTATLLTPEKQQIKIRLAQIDAPEKAQPFGQRSKQSLSELIFGEEVRVKVETTDRYGRTVGRIFLDNLDINLEQVRRGMAWAYRHYLADRSFLDAEQIARSAKRGIWGEPNPVPPWEFRRYRKAKTELLNR